MSLTLGYPKTLGKWMIPIQISLLIIIFLSLTSWDLPLLCIPPKKSTYTLALHHMFALLELDQYFEEFGDAKEGLRFCSLEVVDEEAWIDQV
jgi:hypothetical protein